MDTSLDASNIAKRLWVGGAPPFDRHLPEFDVLVLCAQELQPAITAFRGAILRCPIPDGELGSGELQRALMTGKQLAGALSSGKTALVTCAMGRNRSALVASLALGLVTQMTSEQIIALVRARRSEACLSNPAFVKILHRYIGPGRVPKRAKVKVAEPRR